MREEETVDQILSIVQELLKCQATVQRERKNRPPSAQVSPNTRWFAWRKGQKKKKKRSKKSKDPVLAVKYGQSTAHEKMFIEESVSPDLSSVSSESMKSEKSMTPPLDFKHGHSSADERVPLERPVSPAVSSVSSESMKSDWSMDPPVDFTHSSPRTRVHWGRQVSPLSPVSSVSSVSMKSDKSRDPPLAFKHSSADEKVHLVRPVTSSPMSSLSSMSLKSDWSMDPPLTFKHSSVDESSSLDLTNKRKTAECLEVTKAVNVVSGTVRTENEIQKKWADLKREVTKRLSAHHQSVAATAGGPATPHLTPFEAMIIDIISSESVEGVVPVEEGENQTTNKSSLEVDDTEEEESVVLDLTVIPKSKPGLCSDTSPSLVPGPSAPHPQLGSCSVPSREGGDQSGLLTDAVLEAQKDTTAAVSAVAEQLHQMNERHTSLAAALQDMAKDQEQMTNAIVALTTALTTLTEAMKK